MKYFEKLSENKPWEDEYSFTENLAGGAGIGATTAALAATMQTNMIKKKLKAVEGIKKLTPNALRMSIIGGLIGATAGAGKYFYEEEKYTKKS
jgi:hypothetical protein